MAALLPLSTTDFYPRPPRGGRQQMCHKIKAIFWQYLHNWIQPTKKQSVFVQAALSVKCSLYV